MAKAAAIAAMIAMLAAVTIAASLILRSDGGAATDTPPEQPDYLERATELLSILDRDGAASDFPLYYVTPEAGWVNEAGVAASRWLALGPPPDLADEHRALGAHLRDMVDAYRDERYSATLTFEEPWNNWWNAAEEHYGVQLLQGAGYMDPTFCPGDIVIVPPSDGEFERWQIVALGRFPEPWESDREVDPHSLLRVAALGGETITVGPAGVTIDGQPAAGDVYADRQADYTFGPVTVPVGQYFLLADKRWKAIDSRHSGEEIGAPTFFKPSEIIGELPADAHGCTVNDRELY